MDTALHNYLTAGFTPTPESSLYKTQYFYKDLWLSEDEAKILINVLKQRGEAVALHDLPSREVKK